MARGGSFRDHRARDPTALKGSPASFSKRGIGARFGLPFWNATRKQHATRSKVARTRVQACASRAKIWSGANASSLTLHLHFADVKIAPGPLIRICIFEASRGALPFP